MSKVAFAASVLLATVVLAVAIADASEDSPWSFGLKGGINLADLRGDDVDVDTDFRLGATGGGFLTYSISDWFALQPEILYSQKGAEFGETIAGAPVEVTGKLDYLEIPILAKLTIPINSTFTPNLFIGPAFSFLLSAKLKAEAMGVTIIDLDTKDFQKSFDVGLVFGGGIDIAVGTGKITADTRYVMGLMNIDDPEVGDAPDVKNSVISFMVGYGF